MQRIAMIAVVLISFVSATSAISCYVCAYGSIAGVETGTNCRGPTPDASHQFDCGSSVDSCTTVCSSATLLGITTSSITRTCGVTGTTDGCTNVSGGQSCTTTCTTANCNTTNGSTNVKINLLAMMMALIAGLLFMKL